MRLVAIVTGQKVGMAKIVVDPTASTASASAITLLLARVLSIAAPIGVCAASPSSPPQRRDQTDLSLAPVLLGHQEDIEKRPQCAAYVGQQEVNRVEREWDEMLAVGL